MPRAPVVSGRDLIKMMIQIGYEVVRQRGSHVFLRHPDGRTTVIPDHPGEHIDRGLLNKIIRKDLQLSRQDFLDLL